MQTACALCPYTQGIFYPIMQVVGKDTDKEGAFADTYFNCLLSLTANHYLLIFEWSLVFAKVVCTHHVGDLSSRILPISFW